jgi:Glycosyltransferase
MKVVILGIQGVPAAYGGFETLTEHLIGENRSADISYTVFCSSREFPQKAAFHKGAQLKYIPCQANGMMSVLYDTIGLIRSMRGYDVILILGVSGGIFLPVFRLFCRKKILINVDGLEHRREKWGKFSRWFLRVSEALAVRFAHTIIADNEAIREYVWKTYRQDAELIPYGGDHAVRPLDPKSEAEILNRYNLTPGKYAVSVCRIEPENNCHVTLEAFATAGQPLLFIGNWDRNDYGKKLLKKYGSHPHIRLVGPVYDLETLYVLRKQCGYYIHGHSAGGTNPSLVEAMHCGCNIIAYDCIYNRLTTENRAYYFRDASELTRLISSNLTSNSLAMIETAGRRYTWKTIVEQYENLY